MRYANRLLAVLLAVLAGAVAAVLIIEVIAQAVGSAPVVVPWDRAATWAGTATWTATSIRFGAIVAVVLGVVLLVLEVKPARVSRLAATTTGSAIDTGYTRSGVAAAARIAAERVDGVADADVTVKRGSLHVTATSTAHNRDTARSLVQPVTTSVQQQLDRLQLASPLRVTVDARARRS